MACSNEALRMGITTSQQMAIRLTAAIMYTTKDFLAKAKAVIAAITMAIGGSLVLRKLTSQRQNASKVKMRSQIVAKQAAIAKTNRIFEGV